MIEEMILVIGVITVITGGLLLITLIWYLVYCACQRLWSNTLTAIEIRQAYVFYRQYHGQLEGGKLVCPGCIDSN